MLGENPLNFDQRKTFPKNEANMNLVMACLQNYQDWCENFSFLVK